MLEFKEKQKARKIRHSRPVLFALLVIFLVSVEGLWGIYQKHNEALEKAQEAKADLQKLREREAELEKKVAFLKTERGRDEEIRKKFMVGKEGEGVILVVDPSLPDVSVTPLSPPPSLWARFLDFFK